MKDQTPLDWQHKRLDELLDAQQMKAVTQIINSNTPDKWERLREYLITQHEQLEAKGVLPEYLAYCLEYRINQ